MQCVDASKVILMKYREYFTRCKELDDIIISFFQGKPVTKCEECLNEYAYNRLPDGHEIPPELKEGMKTNKKWKETLKEAEEACRILAKGIYISLSHLS